MEEKNKKQGLANLSNEEIDEMYMSLTRSSDLNLTPMAKMLQEEMLARHNNFFNADKKEDAATQTEK